MATVLASAGFMLEGVVLLIGIVLVALMLWRAPLVGALVGGGIVVAFVGWLLGFLLLALHQEVSASAWSLWADDVGMALVLAGVLVAMWRGARPRVAATDPSITAAPRPGGQARAAVIAVLLILVAVLSILLVARGRGVLVGSAPAASATPTPNPVGVECNWVESTLEQDSRNDTKQPPPGADRAALDRASHAWLVIDNMVRAAPCARQASTTGAPDAPVPAGYLAGTPPKATQAGCSYELGWVHYGRSTHTEHLQFLEQGGPVPWPGESRTHAEQWDQTWIENYTKIAGFLDQQGDCAQFGGIPDASPPAR